MRIRACEEEEHGEREGEGEGERRTRWWFTSISECEVDPDSEFICCLETKLTILVQGDIFSCPFKDIQDFNAAWWKEI